MNMKRKLFVCFMLLMALWPLSAQTFSSVNDDGVSINYVVVSATDHTVFVDTGNYVENVVVPQTVEYDDTLWTVIGVQRNAFYNTAVRYVHLPSTAHIIKSNCFKRCNNLDSLRFDSETPVTMDGGYIIVFGDDNASRNVTVIVPCGSLAVWRNSTWNKFRHIKSDCSYLLTLIADHENIVKLDSVMTSNGLQFSSCYHDVGDTVEVLATPFTSANRRYGFFYGWSDGSPNLRHSFVMPNHDDTLICYVDTMTYAMLSTNHISTPVYMFGTMSYNGKKANYHFRYINLETGNMEVGNSSTVYATAMWIGSGENVAASRFMANGYEYTPGPLRINDATSDVATVRRFSRVWHLTREMIDYHIAHCGEDGYVPDDNIATWPGNGDSTDGFAAQLAPYYDADNDGRYLPLAGDYPIIRGDECVFCIYNDGFIDHSESGGAQFGLEIHCMAYAFNEPNDTALWNTVFMHYDIYNRSANNYPDTYLGAWTDFDIGYCYDDYIGSDVQHSMFYGYNGDDTDGPGAGSFDGYVPAQGCAILGGADNGDGTRLRMSNFVYYENSLNGLNGEPAQASDYYNYLRSQWRNGQHVKYGGNGITYNTIDLDADFMFPGNSDPTHIGTNGVVPEINPDDWTEETAGNYPGDRRGVGSSGPFVFTAQTMQQFDLAFVSGFGAEAVVDLKNNTANVERQWSRDTTDSGRPFTYMPYSAPHYVCIADQSQQAMLSIYPNPTSGLLSVTMPADTEVQLFDMMGRLLMAKHCTKGITTLDLNDLPQGIYLLRASGSVRRVVKK